MERLEIQPVRGSALPEVADFLHRWRSNEAESPASQQFVCEDSLSIERRLRWLLLENPVSTEDSRFGYCVRDRMGLIRGLTLAFPAAFRGEDQRLLGLCSGSFFVEPWARSMGFYLFRKYLDSPGYSFFFATTCNAQSGELWKNLGGRAVPNSDVEYFFPIRLDILLPAFVGTKTSSEAASGIARIFGRCANLSLRLLTSSALELAVEPCHDWEKLSELSFRHRHNNSIAIDRSAEFLQWRYGPASPLYPCRIYLFRDKQGNEGWFSLGNVTRGKQGQIRGCILLDAIWPREKMSFGPIFREIRRLASTGADAIFFRPQSGIDYLKYGRWVIPHRLGTPRAFVMAAKGAPLQALDSLEYDDSDDSAWSFQWTSARSELSPGRSGSALRRTGKTPEGLPL